MNRKLLLVLALLVVAAVSVLLFTSGSERASLARACVHHAFEGSGFTVCRFDPHRDQFRLVLSRRDGRAIRRLSTLAALPEIQNAEVKFAMNAGMFAPSGAPLGLYVENGVERHPINLEAGDGNFFMQPNGVFSVDSTGAVHIDTTEAYLARAGNPQWATQSGPMLLVGGALHPALTENGASRYVRNAVGLCGLNHTLFVISDAPVSFGRLARLFRDALHCSDALYLDGAVSSLWAPGMRRLDNRYDLGPLLVISED